MSLLRCDLVLAGLLIVSLSVVVVPASASVITINPGDSIQVAINSVKSGDTIIMNPGIYPQHDITIPKNIIVRANTSYGGSAADTIIDAQMLGRIFDNSGGYSLTIRNLTLRNGSVNNTSGGGAIYSYGGTLTITSTDFVNCSTLRYNGGAITSFNGVLTFTSSSFSNCSAPNNGGAIFSYEDTITVTSSTFTNSSAGSQGGAILSSSGTYTITITNSSFSNCSANYGGGAIASDVNNILIVTSTSFINCTSGYWGGAIWTGNALNNIASSTFANCSAVRGGGAVYALQGNTTITNSTIANCSATGDGGAVYADSGNRLAIKKSSLIVGCSATNGGAIFAHDGGVVNIDSSAIIKNCTASNDGGAIYAASGSNIRLTSSTIADCSATNFGGAVFVYGTTTITSSTIANCSAADRGGAIFTFPGSTITITSSTIENCSAGWDGTIYNNGGTVSIHFSRLFGNRGAVYNSYGTLNAANNWWGTNANPSGFTSGGVTVSPWLVLTTTATPASITSGQTSTIRATLTKNSAGIDTASGGIFVPDGITNTFAVMSGSGSVWPLSNMTVNGVAKTRYRPAGNGTSTISATVDGQTVSVPVTVPTKAPVTHFNGTPRSGIAPMTVSFLDKSTNSPGSWKWTFGDNSPANSTKKNPVHTYTRAGTYNVSLRATNALGSNTTIKTGYIIVTASPPTITSITPDSGPRTGNTTVWIKGTHFVSGGSFSVKIGGVAATSILRFNTTTIRAKTPAGTPGARTVVVTNNDGQKATRVGGFTYL
jgi:PKD repeat protein